MSATPSSFAELIQIATIQETDNLDLTLQSLGIEAVIEPIPSPIEGGGAKWSVLVPETELERARQILAEEPVPPVLPASPPAALHPPETLQRRPPGLYWIVGLILVNCLVMWMMDVTGGSEENLVRFRFGASHAPSIHSGEWWRTVTAVFLHIDLHHLIANMGSLLVLGILVLRSLGIGRFYFIYAMSGMAGNWVSFFITPTQGMKAGASGAILGLLGALAGARLRLALKDWGKPTTTSRYKAWHILAMVIAFYGFVVGIGPADHAAHVGGLVAGAMLALILPPPGSLSRKMDVLLEVLLGLSAVILVIIASFLAYRAAHQMMMCR